VRDLADSFQRVPSGIPGLDEMLEGGFPFPSVILLAGSAGTGKTWTIAALFVVGSLGFQVVLAVAFIGIWILVSNRRGIGALVTGVLAILRAKLAWFPFHPLGYVLASSYFMRGCWFIFLLAWIARTLLFRIGGAQRSGRSASARRSPQ
jgi:hypothetical protein